MNRHERLVCQCGGKITRPLPKRCPHCGAEITGVKRCLWPTIYPLLAIALMFGALVAFLWWWVKGF